MKHAFLLLIGILLLTGTLSAQTTPVMVIDTPPPAVLYVGDTFTVEFSCRDPQTNEVTLAQGYSVHVYRASNDELVTTAGSIHSEMSVPARATFNIPTNEPDFYYLQLGFVGCDPINSSTFEVREVAAPTLSFTMQPPSSTYTTLRIEVKIQHSENVQGVDVTLALYDNSTGLVVDPQFATRLTDINGQARFAGLAIWNGGEYYFVASATGLADIQSDVFTMIQPVWTIDTPPPPLLYTDETFVVEFSCRDPQTNVVVDWGGGGKQWELYLADTDELVSSIGIGIIGSIFPAQMTYTIQNLEPERYYIVVSMTGCGEVRTDDFEIRERPITLSTTAACVGPDLAVNIADGNGPFDITASSGINVPVTGVNAGQTVIAGPDKWDDVTITETGGDLETTNLGTFKCRPSETPVPQSPAHRATVNTANPTFTWTGIPDANNYRLFIFDDRNPATRTVDIRQNTNSPATSLTPTQSLTPGRYFWRVRGHVNNVWSLWSVRYTLFVE